MKPSDTITLNAPSEFPLQILHEVAIMTILITRGESLRARPLPPARCARCLPTAPPVFPQRLQQKQTKTAVFQFQKTNAVFVFSFLAGSKAMHHLPDCVKEYFTSATDAAEADPKARRRATTTKTHCR
mgnify:CR=1 FL=1